ncbi:DUF3047 domain-containing protein [Zavarzinia sp. CC-PAN008]|uniref:DUF3047 domain-containing protein n=1 Tax=Zavarzinia sp. CC-PAN008 TaxID=3243332 RepID=UPI003F7499A7
MAASLQAEQVLDLPANVPPWTATALKLQAGQEFTVLASGRAVFNLEPDFSAGPRFGLWYRIGGQAPIACGGRDTWSFAAPHAGTLEVAVLNGEWASPDGTLGTPAALYQGGTGGFRVRILVWAPGTRAADGLASLGDADPAIAAERTRLAAPTAWPPDWRHLWFLGQSDIFARADSDGHAAIAIDTRDDVGILQRAVDFPLTAHTRLEWEWRIDELPSACAETESHVHDYLSVALAGDDGHDITWMWSAALAPGAHFRCPLPTWAHKEHHMVVRGDAAELGRWLAESRPVAADWATMWGDPVPTRVTSIWLIAVSLFQHRRGRGTVRNIALVDGTNRVQVL